MTLVSKLFFRVVVVYIYGKLGAPVVFYSLNSIIEYDHRFTKFVPPDEAGLQCVVHQFSSTTLVLLSMVFGFMECLVNTLIHQKLSLIVLVFCIIYLIVGPEVYCCNQPLNQIEQQ
jgi:hypothetical protein